MERPSIISLQDESFLVRFLIRLNTIKRGKRLYSLNAKQGTRMQICNFFFFLLLSFFFSISLARVMYSRYVGAREKIIKNENNQEE